MSDLVAVTVPEVQRSVKGMSQNHKAVGTHLASIETQGISSNFPNTNLIEESTRNNGERINIQTIRITLYSTTHQDWNMTATQCMKATSNRASEWEEIWFKGVIWCFFKDHYWHALMFKKHNFSNTVHCCRCSMPRFSQMLLFYKVPPSDKHSLLWLANWHSALWLAEHHKPCRKCNSPFHNRELQLSKLKWS